MHHTSDRISTNQSSSTTFLHNLLSAPLLTQVKPEKKPSVTYKRDLAIPSQGLDYYQSIKIISQNHKLIDKQCRSHDIDLNRMSKINHQITNKKKFKSLKACQRERIGKLIENQIDKDLATIVKQKLNIQLPKIVSEKRLDPCLSPSQVKGYKKMKKLSRRKFLQLNNLEFKTSEYPKHYKKGDEILSPLVQQDNKSLMSQKNVYKFSPSKVIKKHAFPNISTMDSQKEIKSRSMVKPNDLMQRLKINRARSQQIIIIEGHNVAKNSSLRKNIEDEISEIQDETRDKKKIREEMDTDKPSLSSNQNMLDSTTNQYSTTQLLAAKMRHFDFDIQRDQAQYECLDIQELLRKSRLSSFGKKKPFMP